MTPTSDTATRPTLALPSGDRALRALASPRTAAALLGAAIGLVGLMLLFDVAEGRTPASGIVLAMLIGTAVSTALGSQAVRRAAAANDAASDATDDAAAASPAVVPAPVQHGPRNTQSVGEDDDESFPRLFAKQAQMLDTLAGDCNRLLTNDLLVRDLMTTGVTTALPDTPVERLAVLMRELDVHHLIVCGADRQILGIVSDRDVTSCGGKKAEDIMTPDPFTLPPDALVRTAMSHMIERRISSVPIVDAGKLVGILTTTDVIIAFQCTMQVVRAAAANLVPKPGVEAATLPLTFAP